MRGERETPRQKDRQTGRQADREEGRDRQTGRKLGNDEKQSRVQRCIVMMVSLLWLTTCEVLDWDILY